MSYWHSLKQGVEAALETERIGEPVLVRCTAGVAEGPDELGPAMGQLLALAEGWLGAPPRKVYALGDGEQGHLSATVEFTGGATAILAVTLGRGRPAIDLAVVGNRGAIYQNENLVPARDGDLSPQPLDGVSGAMIAFEISLAIGKPVLVEEEAQR